MMHMHFEKIQFSFMVSKGNFTALLELKCKVDHWHHKGVPFGSEH